MSESISETPEQQNERVRDIAERAETNPEEFKEEVQKLTEQDLNALSHVLLEGDKEKLNEEVRTEIHSRLVELDNINTEVNLDQLKARLPAVATVLQEPEEQPTNKERLKQDVDTAAASVTTSVVGAYEVVKQKYLNPLKEKTKDMFLIGPLIATLSDISPSQIKDVVTRKWYEFLASADMFGGEDSKGFLGKMLGGVSDNARRNLAIFDIRDSIKEYASENRSGETITFDENITKVEWRKMKELTEKNPGAIATNVGTLIEQRRKAGVQDITFACADIIAPPANAEAPADNAREAALLAAKKEIPAAEKIVIAEGSSGVVTLDWNGEKTVTLPMTTDVSKSTINTLINMPRANRFSVIEIGPNDTLHPNEILLKNRNGITILFAENNDEMLQAIPNHEAEITMNGDSQKFAYLNGSFSRVTGETMPVNG